MIQTTFFTLWRRATNLESFTGQVSLTMATNVVVAVLGVVTGILAARLLGPAGRGDLAAIQLWPTFIAVVAMLGLDSAVVYFCSRFPERAGRYLTSALALLVLSCAGFFALGFWLLPIVLTAYSPAIIAAAQVFLLGMLVTYILVGMPHQVLRAMGAWRAWNLFRILPMLGYMLALLIAYFFSIWEDPVSFSRLFILANLVLVVPIAFLTWRYVPPPFQVQTTQLRPLLRYGVPSMLNVLPHTLNLRLDQMLMAVFLSPELLGLYVVAVAWSNAAAPLLNAMGAVLFPRLSALSDRGQQQVLLSRVMLVSGMAVLISVLILLLATPFVLPLLFGAAYQNAVPAAMILVIASGLSSLNLTLAEGLRGLGQPQHVLVAELLGLGVTVTLLYLLLPRFNIVGAAVASLVAYAVVLVFLAFSAKYSVARRGRTLA